MIKVFTLNKNNKIELTKQELEKLLNESFWEGYNKRSSLTWTYTSPSPWWDNNYYYTTSSATANNNTITLKTNDSTITTACNCK